MLKLKKVFSPIWMLRPNSQVKGVLIQQESGQWPNSSPHRRWRRASSLAGEALSCASSA